MIKNRVKVSICGVSYSLVGDENELHVFRAAEQVTMAMRAVMDGGVVEREKAAVLVALQLASEILKQQNNDYYQKEEVERLIEKIERSTQLLTGLS